MQYSVRTPDRGVIEYREPKRWLWALVFVFVLKPILAVGLFLAFGNPWLLVLPLVVAFLLVPVLDWVVGVDTNNPPEELVPQLEADPHYNRLLILCIPAHILAVGVSAWLVGTHDVGWGFFIAFAAAVGVFSGLSINTAHEIGHKNNKRERVLSRIALAVTGYGHFCSDHNIGHHRDVATPEDPASSRMGESIYQFMRREIPGAVKRGWREEEKRLTRKKQPVFSFHNHILQSYLMTLVFQGGFVLAFGWPLIVFFIIHNFTAWFQLTSANYIEHYGLLRAKKANGRYEPCKPYHSWNANHFVSNLALFQLQRHSDHHAKPARSYQSLRSLDNLPELPSGYLGMYLLAYVPQIWFKVMDKRLLEVPHINGDLEKVNIDPAKEQVIRLRYAQP